MVIGRFSYLVMYINEIISDMNRFRGSSAGRVRRDLPQN